MSTTLVTAGQVMDRSAALMNDPQRTDYTYAAQLPYLNMAIDELIEALQESQSPLTNLTTVAGISAPIGTNKLTPVEQTTSPPHYPQDLVEIQEVSEKLFGSDNVLIPMVKREFVQTFPAQDAFVFWVWEDMQIKFNPNGAKTHRFIELKYLRHPIQYAESETSPINLTTAISYLSYKTAALCAQFIGENESRAAILDAKADRAMERIEGIHNKGRQQIMTRHRPFRAAWKSRGAF